MKKLIGMKGGQDSTYFEVLESVKVDNIVWHPSIKDGVEIKYTLCGTEEEHKEYWANKQEVIYLGYRLLVAGNAVSAEMALQDMGYNATAVSPDTVEIRIEQAHGGPREGAGRPATGRSKKNIYVTEREFVEIKKLISRLRDRKIAK